MILEHINNCSDFARISSFYFVSSGDSLVFTHCYIKVNGNQNYILLKYSWGENNKGER